MIYGSHVVIYSTDAPSDRAVFRDVLGWRSVDAGGGWLIFALPPAEAAIHPAESSSTGLFLMSDDLAADIALLAANGIRCSEVEDARWGTVTRFTLPGGAEVGLYQPTHDSPLSAPGVRG